MFKAVKKSYRNIGLLLIILQTNLNRRKLARSDRFFLKFEARTHCDFLNLDFFFLIFRFAKLLLRLPALRSIGLKCAEHHFFFKLVTEDRSMFEMDEQV